MAILTPPVPITQAPPVQLTGGGYIQQGMASRAGIEQAKIAAGASILSSSAGAAADVVASRVKEKGDAGQLELDKQNSIFAQYLEQAKLELAQDENESNKMNMLLGAQDKKAALEAKLGPKPDKPLSPEAAKYSALSKEGLGSIETLRLNYSGMSTKDRLLSEKWVPGIVQSESHQAVSSATQSLVESIGRLHSGAAITTDEWKNFRALIPTVFDKPKTVESKLNRLKTQLSDVYADINAGRRQYAEEVKAEDAGQPGYAEITSADGKKMTLGSQASPTAAAAQAQQAEVQDPQAKARQGRYGTLVPKPGDNSGQRTHGSSSGQRTYGGNKGK